jgi:hypothetical protein
MMLFAFIGLYIYASESEFDSNSLPMRRGRNDGSILSLLLQLIASHLKKEALFSFA